MRDVYEVLFVIDAKGVEQDIEAESKGVFALGGAAGQDGVDP